MLGHTHSATGGYTDNLTMGLLNARLLRGLPGGVKISRIRALVMTAASGEKYEWKVKHAGIYMCDLITHKAEVSLG